MKVLFCLVENLGHYGTKGVNVIYVYCLINKERTYRPDTMHGPPSILGSSFLRYEKEHRVNTVFVHIVSVRTGPYLPLSTIQRLF